jgi:hypothetical protein
MIRYSQANEIGLHRTTHKSSEMSNPNKFHKVQCETYMQPHKCSAHLGAEPIGNK